MKADSQPTVPHALPSPANDALPACLDALRAAELPAMLGEGNDSWAPELPLPPSLWELFSSADDASGEALALAFAQGRARGPAADQPWLWVQDAGSIRRGGYPCLHGLPPDLRNGLLHVTARNGADALWAMEEGVRCGALAFVLGEISGDPKQLDFTATRRLVLAAERHGVPLYLVRRAGFPNLSAARLRWQVAAAPSAAHRWNPQAPGTPQAVAELFRGRGLRPGRFTLTHGIGVYEPGTDQSRHRLAVVAELRDRPVEPERSLAG